MLEGYLDSQPDSQIKTAFEPIYAIRLRPFKWIGAGCGLVGVYFAVRNALVGPEAGRGEKRAVGFLARLIGRSVD